MQPPSMAAHSRESGRSLSKMDAVLLGAVENTFDKS
jgi:hypothetical protein